MRRVVALKLKSGAVAATQALEDRLYIFEGVLEYPIPRGFQVLRFPVLLEILVTREHGVHAEVHRSHVQRTELGRYVHRCGEPLIYGHALTAAGGDVDHRISRLLDPRKELHEHLRIGRRATG